jgi:transposase-like protein
MSVEVLGPAERRRRWSEDDKAALVAATDQFGVTAAARQHRVSTSLLYNWRAARRAAAELGVPGLGHVPPGGVRAVVNWPAVALSAPAKAGQLSTVEVVIVGLR